MSSCSLSALSIRAASNNLCSLYVVITRKKTDVGFIPKATAPTTAVPCLVPTQHPVTQRASVLQGWAQQAALLLGKSPCVSEPFLCNRVDLAAFAFLAGEEVTWKALSSPNVTSELGAITLRWSTKLQLWLGNFEMSRALLGSCRVRAVSHRDHLSILPPCPSLGDPLDRSIPQIIQSPWGWGSWLPCFLLAENITPDFPVRERENSDCCDAPGFSSNSKTLG